MIKIYLVMLDGEIDSSWFYKQEANDYISRSKLDNYNIVEIKEIDLRYNIPKVNYYCDGKKFDSFRKAKEHQEKFPDQDEYGYIQRPPISSGPFRNLMMSEGYF